MTLDEIFARTLQKSNGCWEWQGALNSDGYGVVYIRKVGQRRVHRYVMEKLHGVSPKQVLHICDNPMCCNPEHLINGTAQMNMDDCIRKGRLGKTGAHLVGKGTERCVHGHLLSGSNLKVTVEKGYEKRRCRLCARDRKAKYLATAAGQAKHNEGQVRRYHARKLRGTVCK